MTLDIPDSWARCAAAVAAGAWRRMIVLGAADSGKSSFCRFLGGFLAARGATVDLLDTDLGQTMAGPPGGIGLARFDAAGALHPDSYRFVGETNPAGAIAAVVAASARLASAATADRLLVNSSGLVTGPGIALKRWKLEALDPDIVVAIARGEELAPILALVPPPRLHRLAPSTLVRRKSPALRARNRVAALSTALGHGRTIVVPGLVVEELRHRPPPADQLRLCSLADAMGAERGIGLVRLADHFTRQEVWTSLDPIGLFRLRVGMPLHELREAHALIHNVGDVEGTDGDCLDR